MMHWLILSITLVNGDSYLLRPEQQQEQLTQHAMFPAEGQQHQQLALSLRNQRLLEQQAESRARQMQYQLQAAEAIHAMRQLSILVATPELTASSEENTSNRVTFQVDLHRFQLLALFKRNNQWIARLRYGEHIFAVGSGDTILGDIHVQIVQQSVVLSHEERRHTLQVGG